MKTGILFSILVSLVSLSNCQQGDQKLSYSKLSSNNDGRHFLMMTLLEHLYDPIDAPRFRGNVVFDLPQNLGGSPISLRSGGKSCCELKDVPFKYKKGYYTKEILEKVLKDKGILKYKRGTLLDDFDPSVKKDVNVVADIINGDQRPFDHMMSIAATVKDMINENLFAKAMITTTVRRTDVEFAVPNMAEIMGPAFLPNQKQLERQVKQLVDNGRNDADMEIFADWTSPEFRTYPPSEIESKLWYLREDPEVNSHHWYWHILFGDGENFNKDELQDRRGELFYFLHNQVCNRYNFERLSNGMDLVEGYTPTHWNRPIELGYDPKLGDLSTDYYPPREDNVFWYGHPAETRKMEKLVKAFKDSTRKGYLSGPNGEKVKLGYKDGRDYGIIPLGATVEVDPLRTVNNETYGDIHNGGHYLMARAGLHKQLVDAGIRNALGNTATECRDPLLYRWHGYIDSIFADYKQTLGPYTDEDLDFPGIEIEDAAVYSSTDDQNALFGNTLNDKNTLFTHMDYGDVGFYGADINNVTISNRIRIKYKRLNHSPFVYRFKVRNNGPPVRGLVRLFLADEKGTPTTVEMDKFLWNFKTGTSEFERSYEHSSSVPRKAQTLYEIQESSSYSGSNNLVDTGIREYTGCGWPKHLLVPRGNPEGFKTNLLVVISPLLKDDAAKNTDWKTVSTLTHSLCGAPGAKFPDSRPMGYPFDRYRGWQNIVNGRSNMKRVGITIYHQEDCKRNRDCPRGRTCDTELGRCNVDNVAPTQTQRPRQPKENVNSPIRFEECPYEVGTAPKLNIKISNGARSSYACESNCRKVGNCAYFEYKKLSGRMGRCTLYEHIKLEPGHSRSVSGLKDCGKSQKLFQYDTCTLKDRKPTLKHLTTWRNLRSAELCRKRCDGEPKCESWEWQKSRESDRSGVCHAYKMDFRSSANSFSGPVECRV